MESINTPNKSRLDHSEIYKLELAMLLLFFFGFVFVFSPFPSLSTSEDRF